MQYHVSTKNVELTDQMRGEVLSQLRKLEPLVQHFPADATNADFTVERHQRTGDYVISLRLGLTGTVLVSREQHPDLGVATRSAVDEIIIQLERYKARLSGEAAVRRASSEFPSEAVPRVERILVDERELFDRSVAGDADAFNELTRRHLPAVDRVMRRELRQRGIGERADQTAVIERLLGQIMASALRDLSHKPSRMSMQGWLSLKARTVLEDELRSQEPDLGQTA